MSKSFEDVKKALEAVADGAALLEALDSHVKTVEAAEKDKGIKAKNAANKEAEGLRNRLKKVEEKFELDTTADDFEAKIDGLVSKLKVSPPKPGQEADVKSSPEYMELSSNFKKLATSMATIENDRKILKEKTEDGLRKSALVSALTKAKVHKDFLDDQVELLKKHVKVKDDDSVFIEKDGEPITIEDFVGGYVKQKPRLLENPQSPGGGSGPGGGEGRPNNEPSVEERRKKLQTLTQPTI